MFRRVIQVELGLIKELTFSKLRNMILKELRQDKIEVDIRKANQGLKDSSESVETSQPRANTA